MSNTVIVAIDDGDGITDGTGPVSSADVEDLRIQLLSGRDPREILDSEYAENYDSVAVDQVAGLLDRK